MEHIATEGHNKMIRVLDTIISTIILGISFLIPLFFLPISAISLQFGTSLLFGFGVIVAFILYIVRTFILGYIDVPRPNMYATIALLAIPVVYVLAGISNGFSRLIFLGYTFDMSTVGFMFLSFIYLYLIMLFFRSQQKIAYGYTIFLISSLITALFIGLRLIFGATFLSFGLFTDIGLTVIGSWNSVAIFFSINVLLAVLMYHMAGLSRLFKGLILFSIVISVFFLIAINFSMVWIGLAVILALIMLLNFSLHHDIEASFKRRIMSIKTVPTVVFVLSLFFIFSGSTISQYIAQKINIVNNDVRPSLSVTYDIAKNTIKNKPLFGSGSNTFLIQWLSYKPDEIVLSDFWNADFIYGVGIIPTFIVTTGATGFISWMLFFAFFLYVGIKSLFEKVHGEMERFFITSSFLTSLFLWIMMWVYVPSIVIFIITFFFTGLFFASVYSTGVFTIEKKIFSAHPKSSFITSLVLMTLFFGVLVLGYALYRNSRSLWYFQKGIYVVNNGGTINDAQREMEQAIKIVPYDLYYRALVEVKLSLLNQVAGQDQKTVPVETIQKQFSDVLADVIKIAISAKDADQSNYLNWITLAKTYHAVVPYKVQGAYESAQMAYTEALRRNPKNPGILVMLARLEADRGEMKLARNFILQAITLKKNYADAYFLLSQIEVADNNLKGAIDSVTALSVIDPTNANVFFQLGLLQYNAKNIPEAIGALEKAIAITPDYANAKYFLGLSYETIGEHEKALDQFTDLAKTNPDSKEVADIIEKITTGKSIFADPQAKPEKASKLPVKQPQN